MGQLFSKKTPADLAFHKVSYRLNRKHGSNLLQISYRAENRTALSGSGVVVDMTGSNKDVYNDLNIISDMGRFNNAYGIAEDLEISYNNDMTTTYNIKENENIKEVINLLLDINISMPPMSLHNFLMNIYWDDHKEPLFRIPINKFEIIPFLGYLDKYSNLQIEIDKFETKKGKTLIWDLSMLCERMSCNNAIDQLKR